MTGKRKDDHLKICIENDVEAGDAGFDYFRLRHRALPEIDFDDVDLSTKLLGHKLSYPIMIEAITGGVSKAQDINRDLASLAEEYGIGFGVGSQRRAIEDPGEENTYKVRDVAPNAFLVANLGAVQLNYGYGLKECIKAIEMIDADALALHINPLQEAVQPEGDRDFSGLTEKINKIAADLKKPVIAKCVGCGMDYESAKDLRVAAFDVGGAGGTSWSLIEGLRGDDKTLGVGLTFAGWGVPTSESISCLSGLNVPVIGSGGVRSGIDAAKALALGASCVGVALPVLRAWADNGRDGVSSFLEQFIYELKTALFLTGSKDIKDLRGRIDE